MHPQLLRMLAYNKSQAKWTLTFYEIILRFLLHHLQLSFQGKWCSLCFCYKNLQTVQNVGVQVQLGWLDFQLKHHDQPQFLLALPLHRFDATRHERWLLLILAIRLLLPSWWISKWFLSILAQQLLRLLAHHRPFLKKFVLLLELQLFHRYLQRIRHLAYWSVC